MRQSQRVVKRFRKIGFTENGKNTHMKIKHCEDIRFYSKT